MTDKTPRNYFNLDPKYSKLDIARFVILPAPYERTTSYEKGCVEGPEAMLRASAQVELFEPDVAVEPYRLGIYSAPAVKFGKGSDEVELEKIRKAAAPFVKAGKFLITLGGEHTITAPLIKVFADRFTDLSVLHIDAHPDLRDKFGGNPYSHACAARRVLDYAPVVQVGVRSWDADQDAFMKQTARKKINGQKALTVFPAQEIAGRNGWQKKVIDALSENVYLSFDLDGLDPSVVPGVGTPEPGGLGWYETLILIKELTRRKNLVGMDIVELMPIKGEIQSETAATRLLHRIMAYQALKFNK